MGENILKYKVINIKEITKEALEKMLEEAYNEGYKDATTFYTKPLNDYSNIASSNSSTYKSEENKVEDWCKNLQAQKDY